jgi:hypothetical protein
MPGVLFNDMKQNLVRFDELPKATFTWEFDLLLYEKARKVAAWPYLGLIKATIASNVEDPYPDMYLCAVLVVYELLSK